MEFSIGSGPDRGHCRDADVLWSHRHDHIYHDVQLERGRDGADQLRVRSLHHFNNESWPVSPTGRGKTATNDFRNEGVTRRIWHILQNAWNICRQKRRDLRFNHRRLGEKGFAAIFLAPIMAVFVTLVFGAGSTFAIWRHNTKTFNECQKLNFGFMTAKEKHLKALLKLNGPARALRIRKKLTQIKLAAALSRGDVATATALSAELHIIAQKQVLLDQQQRLIFSLVKVDHGRWRAKVNLLLRPQSTKGSSSLPVLPSSFDLAPAYEVSRAAAQADQTQARGKSWKDSPWVCSAGWKNQEDQWVAGLIA
jgi:hypothetical protein